MLSAVKAFRASAGVRISVVIATLLSWIVLSNHCALGGMSNTPAAHQCCAKKTTPAKEDGGRSGDRVILCCKTMRATITESHWSIELPCASAPLPFGRSLDRDTYPELLATAEKPATGPPDSGGYITSVLLKHSLPALAPPIAA
jgi:hypothetical protein